MDKKKVVKKKVVKKKAEAVSFADINAILDRVARRQEETARRQEEAARRSEEEAARRQEEDRRYKEEERRRSEEEAARRQEEDRRYREEERRYREKERLYREEERRRSEEADRRSEEANRRSAEADRRSEELDRKIDKMCERVDKLSEELGGVTNNIGYHAEEFFQNALAQTLTFGGEKYDGVISNLAYKHKNDNAEFDIVLVNGKSVALIEAKNRIHPKSVQELAQKKIAQFRKYFTVYKNHKVYLGMAGFSISGKALEEAIKYGIGIIRQDGQSVEVKADHLKVY